ncbi:MAG: hypothetical protein VX527_05115 [Planctomycetota bacterium]|nr:hypothetical protein [Planctomycetota bacterium]
MAGVHGGTSREQRRDQNDWKKESHLRGSLLEALPCHHSKVRSISGQVRVVSGIYNERNWMMISGLAGGALILAVTAMFLGIVANLTIKKLVTHLKEQNVIDENYSIKDGPPSLEKRSRRSSGS